MPSTCCAVPQCSNRGGHQFPSDHDMCKLWVIAIRRAPDSKSDRRGRLWWPSGNSVVCGKHFNTDDYRIKTTLGNVH